MNTLLSAPCSASVFLLVLRTILAGLVPLLAITSAQAGVKDTAKSSEFHVLVIGNEKYSTPIPGPVREARDVAEVFQKSGAATVEVATDAGREVMENHLAEFAKKGKSGGTAVFYFAGSGFQRGQRDLLLPVESGGMAALPVALDVGDIRSELSRGGFSHVILVLDVCRHTKTSDQSFLWYQPHGVEALPAGVALTTFRSASPGEFALSKKDDISPFCTAFLRAVAKGRRPMFEVAWEVMRELTTVEPKGIQQPWFESNASQPLYLGWNLQDVSQSVDDKKSPPKR